MAFALFKLKLAFPFPIITLNGAVAEMVIGCCVTEVGKLSGIHSEPFHLSTWPFCGAVVLIGAP